ncbi:MAG TPA: ATP-binding cassette domain-containing protein [Cerasibacillus sp.]|uniref:ATP-binding cassette domain-containing protein n=1 Tax=Cerasibacillus sp. TaxID=2498711 RepID=UPI002F403A5A
MIIMQLSHISKYYGADKVFDNIKLEIKDRDRIAIVGRNGAGKSTLLKIIAGLSAYEHGERYIRKDITIGYLSQHTGLVSNQTIWQEMLAVFEPLLQKETELRQLEQRMTEIDSMSPTDYQSLLKTYDEKQQQFEASGGYTYEAEIRSVLTGLNFAEYDDNTPINELSGGQKTRLALGKLLLKKPNLLILDEPTNHLDIETLSWLESYLIGYPGALVIVSHDRYFLDKTVNTVYEIAHQRMKKYHGSYSKYLEFRAKEYEIALKEYEKQQTEIKRMEDFIQRNIARASTTKRAQSRRKQLEKMDIMERPLGDEASANFSFKIDKKSGNDVLKVDNLSFRYTDTETPLFRDVSFHVNRGERIAVVGPNGVGKTTLLKTIVGSFQPIKGSIHYGTNVDIGYYDQELNQLSSNKTVLLELWDDYPTVDEKEIRQILGHFLFSGDDVLKLVSSLSGGEKARLALAKLHMKKANLLVLDEPTNHLDIDSKEVLESALINFPGTIIFVSHDRYFINKIADQVIELAQDKATVYLGDYDYYIEKKIEERELQALNQQEKEEISTVQTKQDFQEEKKRQSERRKLKRKIKQIEEQIEALESKHSALEEKMTNPDVYQNHEKSYELMQETESIMNKIHKLMEEWEMLEEELIHYE